MRWILFACLLVNGLLLLFLSFQIKRMIRLNYTLTWLALNSLALRHVGKAQIYALMAVVSKEDLIKLKSQ